MIYFWTQQRADKNKDIFLFISYILYFLFICDDLLNDGVLSSVRYNI